MYGQNSWKQLEAPERSASQLLEEEISSLPGIINSLLSEPPPRDMPAGIPVMELALIPDGR